MGRNYLAHSQGDAVNAILAAAGYNFSLLLKWLREILLCLFAVRLETSLKSTPAQTRIDHGRLPSFAMAANVRG